ncbi:MAG: hypothetical protein KDK91_04755 [Gammaproteobacteria bacterium]|nr:hypothetical protein [Gammaproteobacteria bacterium]
MTKLRGLLSVFVILGMLSGCMHVETVVRVNPDGTGEVRETMIMGQELVNMTRQMSKGLGGAEGKDGDTGLYDRADLEAKAKTMGEGARLVDVQPARNENGEGYVATYAFDDINTLSVSQSPGEPGGQGATGKSQAKPAQMIRFSMPPAGEDGARVLAINIPSKGSAGEQAGGQRGEKPGKLGNDAQAPRAAPPKTAADAEMDKAAMNMMKQMFKGMRMNLAVEVDGEILETNASYVEGSRITLIDVEFDRLLDDAEKLARLASGEPDNIDAIKSMLSGVSGLRAELEPSVTVRFKAGNSTKMASTSGMPEARDPRPVSAPAAVAPTAVAPPAVSQDPVHPVIVGPSSGGSYAWHRIERMDLQLHTNSLLKVVADDGQVYKGALTSLNDNQVNLRLAGIDGGGKLSVPLDKVAALEVFERR